MIVVLQGMMSSKVELVQGGVTGDVTGSELAEVCQQSDVSVTGHNREPLQAPHLQGKSSMLGNVFDGSANMRSANMKQLRSGYKKSLVWWTRRARSS